jgi:uncharacterized membrane protein
MAFGDQLQTSVRKGPPCTVSLALEQLSPEETVVFHDAMRNPQQQGTRIAAELRREGYNVKDDALQRHRRGLCACGDES